MKKYSIYIFLALAGIFIFFLNFSYGKKYYPYTYYQVYLDNQKVGVIESKDELEDYINKQGSVIKEQVLDYQNSISKINNINSLMKKYITRNSSYYVNYVGIYNLEKYYNELLKNVDYDGNIITDYDSALQSYNNFDSSITVSSRITNNKIVNFEAMRNNIDSVLKSYQGPIVDYLYDNRTKLDLTSSELSLLEEYVSDKLINTGYTKYIYMIDYAQENEIYLHTDDIYKPLGINIKKITTYESDYMKIEDAYAKIVDNKPCTIEGFQFRIKSSKDVILSDGSELGYSLGLDFTKKPEANDNEIIYVTDKSIFNDAIEEVAAVFVGNDKYEAYKSNKQKEIETTGSKIENIYLKEDITVKETNISVKEKIYTNASDLASFLLYGEEIKTKQVRASSRDNITDLAYKNKISIEEFFLSNPSFTSIDNIFYEGQLVTITELNPVINLVVDEYQVEDKTIDYSTVEKYDSIMTLGSEYVEQKGSKGIMRVSQKIQKINGQSSIVTPISNVTIKAPKDKIVLVGTKVVPHIGSTGSWGWPTNSGYTITSYFGYRNAPFGKGRELHSGLDIAGTGYGSPIYASNNGVIEQIKVDKWNYGMHVVINHNNGYWTLYGHMSRFAKGIKEGQTVARGQIIGYVGQTGAATGPHLHFEIRVGSNKYSAVTNPLPFLRK